MPFSFTGKDGFDMPLFEWEPPPRTIFDEIADRYGLWIDRVGDPFGLRHESIIDEWVVDGYGLSNTAKSLKQTFRSNRRCHWITNRRSRPYARDGGLRFPDAESAVAYVRAMAESTKDVAYTLAVEIHDLNDILMKARTVE